MQYTDPTIVSSQDLRHKSYIVFYFGDRRHRIYSGQSVGIRLFPNKATSVKERSSRLHTLKQEVTKLLIAGKFPYIPEEVAVPAPTQLPTSQLIQLVLQGKLAMSLSDRYKSDLQLITTQFSAFLTPSEQSKPIAELNPARIDQFLKKFASSGTYFMKKRSDLRIILNAACKHASCNPIGSGIQTLRTKAILHGIYQKDKMLELLTHLKDNSPKLYLCCLMTYGCWLRPHVEIRRLKKSQFKNNATEIHLGGSDNKGGKVRVVFVPDYIRSELGMFLDELGEHDNLFSGTGMVHGTYYFSTLWGRLRSDLLKAGLIKQNQTIYSFRHTAAVFLYRKTKDIYLLQKVLGHGSIGVTQKYLRGLGEVNIDELRDAAPEL